MADQRIENVKPEESWIVGVQDGVIEFRRPMRFLKNTNRIPDIVVFALALTEVCCTGGRGKVCCRPWFIKSSPKTDTLP